MVSVSLFNYTYFVAYFLFTEILYSVEIMLKIICSIIYKVQWVFTFFYDCPSLFLMLFLIKVDGLVFYLYKTALHVSRLLLKGVATYPSAGG